MAKSKVASQSGVIRLDIADQSALYDAYMPFINNGGLFVAERDLGGNRYDLGDDVFLFLHLLFEDERLPVAGKIVWVAPRGAQQRQGVGIQFLAQDDGQTQRRMETLLADRLETRRATSTL